MQIRKCYIIITSVCIATCLMVTLGVSNRVQAKHIPALTLYIKQNSTTKHNYFDPTFPCIRGRVANVTIKNTTQQVQVILWDTTQKTVTIKPDKSVTSMQHAVNKGIENPNYEIDVLLNPKPLYPPEAAAFITADGIVARCIG